MRKLETTFVTALMYILLISASLYGLLFPKQSQHIINKLNDRDDI